MELAAKTTGEGLLLLRHRAGITRDALANASGVSSGTVSRYELDQVGRPQAAILRRLFGVLAVRLGCDPDDLWAEVGGLLDD